MLLRARRTTLHVMLRTTLRVATGRPVPGKRSGRRRPDPPVSRRGWLLFVSLCVIWGLPYLLIRVAVRELPPATLVFVRTGTAALLLAPLALHRRELRVLFARWRWILAYTAMELAAPWWLLSHAEQRLTSSLAGLIIAAVPLIALVLARAGGSASTSARAA